MAGNCTVDDNHQSAPESSLVDVTVVVKTEDGSPVPDAVIELEDRGGTPDDRYVQTSSEGCARILENTGPPPCNRQTIKLPNHPNVQPRSLGCNNNAKFLEEFVVSDAGECTVEDHSGSGNAERGVVVVKVVLKTESGAPVPYALVELEDRGGSPDDRFARTSPNGCVRFFKGTGPPPCNRQTIKLPHYPNVQPRSLDCNTYASFEEVFVVSDAGKWEGCTVDNNTAGGQPDRGFVGVTVVAKEDDGSPVPDAIVELEDPGGTGNPDDRLARTSSDGCVLFLEGTCNRQTLKLPDFPNIQPRSLGCNNDTAFLEEFVLSGADPACPEGSPDEPQEDDSGPKGAVLGPAVGVPVGVVVLSIIAVIIVIVIRRKKRVQHEQPDPGPVDSRDTLEDYTVLEFDDGEIGRPYLPTSAAPPHHNQPHSTQPPHSEPPHEPPSFFNPLYTWLFKRNPLVEDQPPPLDMLQSGADPSVSKGQVSHPFQPGRETSGPGYTENCLVCLDGPRLPAFWHRAHGHLRGMPASCTAKSNRVHGVQVKSGAAPPCSLADIFFATTAVRGDILKHVYLPHFLPLLAMTEFVKASVSLLRP